MKPNYDIENRLYINSYQTIQVLANILDAELTFRFALGTDDNGVNHYDRTIHQAETDLDSANEMSLQMQAQRAWQVGIWGVHTTEAPHPNLPAFSLPTRQQSAELDKV